MNAASVRDSATHTAAAHGATAAAPRGAAATARRRRALLQLARRHGEVRLRVGDGRCAPPAGAGEVSELLDTLNRDGLVRYGGMSGQELRYLPV